MQRKMKKNQINLLSGPAVRTKRAQRDSSLLFSVNCVIFIALVKMQNFIDQQGENQVEDIPFTQRTNVEDKLRDLVEEEKQFINRGFNEDRPLRPGKKGVAAVKMDQPIEYLRAQDQREDEDERPNKAAKGSLQGQKKSLADPTARVVKEIDDIPIKPSKALVREEKPAEQEEEYDVALPKYDFEAMLEQALQKENPRDQVKKGQKKEAPKKSKTARG